MINYLDEYVCFTTEDGFAIPFFSYKEDKYYQPEFPLLTKPSKDDAIIAAKLAGIYYIKEIK